MRSLLADSHQRMISAARMAKSALAGRVGGLPETSVGMIDVSITRKPSTPAL